MYKTVNNRFYITRGDSADLTLSLTDRAGTALALATGDTLTFTVKASTADAKAIMSKTIGSGITATAGDSTATIHIDPADTAALEYGTYYYDVQMVLASTGDTDTIITPTAFIICEEVTF